MATADAKAHLDTDFYDFCRIELSAHKTADEISQWAEEKNW